MSKIFFFFSFCIYCANFVRIGPQIKKFPKNWVGLLKGIRHVSHLWNRALKFLGSWSLCAWQEQFYYFITFTIDNSTTVIYVILLVLLLSMLLRTKRQLEKQMESADFSRKHIDTFSSFTIFVASYYLLF